MTCLTGSATAIALVTGWLIGTSGNVVYISDKLWNDLAGLIISTFLAGSIGKTLLSAGRATGNPLNCCLFWYSSNVIGAGFFSTTTSLCGL